MTLKVLIVDDSLAYRRLLVGLIGQLPHMQMEQAVNGVDALEKCQSFVPDVITLDFEMPIMGGIAVLQELKARNSKAKVIMLSRHTSEGADLTMQGLQLGAFDFICKPEAESSEQAIAMLQKALHCLLASIVLQQAQPRIRPLQIPAPSHQVATDIVAIGASTGGPSALMQVLPLLPASYSTPIVIVQHMPPLFTEALATALAKVCSLPVQHAQHLADVSRPGITIAPGGRQMKISARRQVFLTDDAKEHFLSPSVDYLFRSIAEVYRSEALGIVLTGMGTDGTEGLRAMHTAGARCLAQAQAGCSVFGMPRAAIRAGCVDEVVPLEKMATAIMSWR